MKKVYKENAFWVGSMIGGPLVGGYFFSENYKTFSHPEKVRPVWFITLLSFIIIFGGIFFIPEEVYIPNQIIPVFYTAIIAALYKKLQKEKVLEHVRKGGVIHGWGRVIIVSLIGLAVTFFGIVLASFVITTASSNNISTKMYGAEVYHYIDYNESNISEIEIDKISEGFTEAGFFDLYQSKYVYVFKNRNTYEIYISVLEGTHKDQNALRLFSFLKDEMERLMPNKNVELHLAVEDFENVVMTLK